MSLRPVAPALLGQRVGDGDGRERGIVGASQPGEEGETLGTAYTAEIDRDKILMIQLCVGAVATIHSDIIAVPFPARREFLAEAHECRIVFLVEPFDPARVTEGMRSLIGVLRLIPRDERTLVHGILAGTALTEFLVTIFIARSEVPEPSRAHEKIELMGKHIKTAIDHLDHQLFECGAPFALGIQQFDLVAHPALAIAAGTGHGIDKMGFQSIPPARQDHIVAEHHHVRAREPVRRIATAIRARARVLTQVRPRSRDPAVGRRCVRLFPVP